MLGKRQSPYKESESKDSFTLSPIAFSIVFFAYFFIMACVIGLNYKDRQVVEPNIVNHE